MINIFLIKFFISFGGLLFIVFWWHFNFPWRRQSLIMNVVNEINFILFRVIPDYKILQTVFPACLLFSFLYLGICFFCFVCIFCYLRELRLRTVDYVLVTFKWWVFSVFYVIYIVHVVLFCTWSMFPVNPVYQLGPRFQCGTRITRVAFLLRYWHSPSFSRILKRSKLSHFQGFLRHICSSWRLLHSKFHSYGLIFWNV